MDRHIRTPPRRNSNNKIESYKNYDEIKIKRSYINAPPPPPPPSPSSPASKQQLIKETVMKLENIETCPKIIK